MKTIFIVIGGMADRPDETLQGETPLMMAATPSLDALAKCGCSGMIQTVPDGIAVTTENAILSLLGYDFSRGVPKRETLHGIGAGVPVNAKDIRYFVVPKFSGYGLIASDDDVVRGLGIMALLRPLFPSGDKAHITESHPCGSLADKAQLATRGIEMFDFVMIYVNEAEIASLSCDLHGKIDALEKIDRELITPVADYVWNAKFQMNLVVTGDHITSWKTGRHERGDVPAVVYFNDDLPYDTEAFDEVSMCDGPLNAPLPGDLIRKLISFEPYVGDDKNNKIL